MSSAVPTTETAACWLVLTEDDRFAYTANAGAGSISGFRVDNNGRLRLLTAGGRTAVTGPGSHPVDLALSRKSQYLYSLNNGNGTVGAFRVNGNGLLEPLTGASGTPASAAGLAAE